MCLYRLEKPSRDSSGADWGGGVERVERSRDSLVGHNDLDILEEAHFIWKSNTCQEKSTHILFLKHTRIGTRYEK